MSVFLGGLVQAGANVVSNLLGNKSIRQQNEASREWSEKMYDKRFQDNIRLWNMQNAYNSPQEQMKRLKAAGLNPALMYGKGAGAGAAGQAGSFNTTDHMSPEFRAVKFDRMASALGAFYDLKIRQAQANNLEIQNTQKYNDTVWDLVKRSGFHQRFKLLQGSDQKSNWFDKPWTERYQMFNRGVYTDKQLKLLESQTNALNELAKGRDLENRIFKTSGFLMKLLQLLTK